MTPEQWWKVIHEDGEVLVGLGGLIATCGTLASKFVRTKIGATAARILKAYRRPGEIDAALQEVLANQARGFEVVSEITYELKTNGGGSVKDAVNRIESSLRELTAREGHRYRLLPYPGFECDTKGRNIRVTDAYLTLLDLKVSNDLDSMDWARFIHADDLDGYFRAFTRAANSNSDFGHPARLYSSKRSNLGLWYISGTRLSCGTYIGKFEPSDNESKAIAKLNKWDY